MDRRPSNVRIGPLSLLTLISVLLLAVLAVLCVTTANAAATMSQRQADMVSETYRLDACGQEVLAAIDEGLAGADGDAASAAGAVNGQLQGRLAELSPDGLSLSLQADGPRIELAVSGANGRSLSAAVSVADDKTWTVEEWKITTTQSQPEQKLWSGDAGR